MLDLREAAFFDRETSAIAKLFQSFGQEPACDLSTQLSDLAGIVGN